jgi:hypothetical protein
MKLLGCSILEHNVVDMIHLTAFLSRPNKKIKRKIITASAMDAEVSGRIVGMLVRK